MVTTLMTDGEDDVISEEVYRDDACALTEGEHGTKAGWSRRGAATLRE